MGYSSNQRDTLQEIDEDVRILSNEHVDDLHLQRHGRKYAKIIVYHFDARDHIIADHFLTARRIVVAVNRVPCKHGFLNRDSSDIVMVAKVLD